MALGPPKAPGSLKLVSVTERAHDALSELDVVVENYSDRLCEPGAIRLIVSRTKGPDFRANGLYMWRIEPGETATVLVIVPSSLVSSISKIGAMEYVEFNGTVTAVDGIVERVKKLGIAVGFKVSSES